MCWPNLCGTPDTQKRLEILRHECHIALLVRFSTSLESKVTNQHLILVKDDFYRTRNTYFQSSISTMSCLSVDGGGSGQLDYLKDQSSALFVFCPLVHCTQNLFSDKTLLQNHWQISYKSLRKQNVILIVILILWLTIHLWKLNDNKASILWSPNPVELFHCALSDGFIHLIIRGILSVWGQTLLNLIIFQVWHHKTLLNKFQNNRIYLLLTPQTNNQSINLPHY